jgi:sensor c-di-GMP phosphodiesterase-like protein
MIDQEVVLPAEFIPPTTRSGLKELITKCLRERLNTDYENIPSDCDTDWDEE